MRRKIWIMMAAAAFGWGTGGVATRAILLGGVDPFTLVPLRFTMATVVLVGWLVATGKLTRDPKAWLAGLAIGAANLSIPTIFFTLSLLHISAGLGGLLVTSIPIVTAVWAHFLLSDEPFQFNKLAGLLVALAGVAILILTGETGFGGGDIVVGVAWSAAGVVLAALGGVLSRIFTQRHSVLDLAGPQFVVTAVIAIAAGLLLGSTSVASVSLDGWLLLGYLAIIGTIVPFIGFLWIVQRVSATEASMVGYLVPLVGLAAGALFLGERITWVVLVAGALIFAGVVMVDRAGTPSIKRAPLL